MKEPSKHMLNGIIIVLVTIIIAITFTINYSSYNKSSAHCYKKVYAERLSRNSTDEAWKKELKTKVQIEGNAAAYAGFRCLKK